MPELLFIQNRTKPSELLNGLDPKSINTLCQANNTYPGAQLPSGSIFSLENDRLAMLISSQLNHLPAAQRQCVSNVAQTCGDETLALAAFLDRYFSDHNIDKLNTAIGAATTAATARLDNFEKAIVEYQKSLNNLRTLAASGRHGRGPAAAIQKAKLQVKEAYQALARQYGIELRRFSAEAYRGKNRGNAFTSSERGIVLATRKPDSPKADVRLNVESHLQASQLARMGKLLNGLGNITIAADASMRVIKVMNIEEAGGDWMREGAKQITGFGAGTASGALLGRAVFSGGVILAAQAGLSLAGPVGWAILGGIFTVSLVAGYFAGTAVDEFAQGKSDQLMGY